MSDVATIDGYQISSNEQSAEQITADIAAIDAPADGEAAEQADSPTTPESDAGKTLQARKTGLEKRKGSIQADIDRATYEKHEAERQRDLSKREADIARREAEQARAEREALKAPEKPAETKRTFTALPDDPNDPKPQQADFEDYEDFVEARAAWTAKKTFASEQARMTHERRSSEAAHARQIRATAFTELLTAIKARVPDYDARTAHLILTRPMQDVLVDDPGFALYLADHDDDYERIRSMSSETAQYGELMRLRGRLEAASDRGPAIKVSPKSTAPAPIKPLASTPAAVLGDGEPDPEDTSPGAQARFDAYWNRRAATR